MREIGYGISEFKREILERNRYFLSDEAMTFLQRLSATCGKEYLDQGTVLYRAVKNKKELCESKYSLNALSDENMKPVDNMFHQDSEGRVNPSNIHCLYLSDGAGGAIAESRPEIGRPVTVAKLSIVRKLKIADFSLEIPNDDRPNYPDLFDDIFDISNDFSRPVMAYESRLGYVPTQIVSEYIKKLGYDGVKYKSKFFSHLEGDSPSDDFFNYALFNINDASIIPHTKNVYIVKGQSVMYGKASESI